MNYKHRKCKLGQIGLIKKSSISKDLKIVFFLFSAAFLGKMSQGSLKDANGTVIGSRLTITGATVENTGSYECTATNTHGTDMGLSKLTVKAVINSNEGSGA